MTFDLGTLGPASGFALPDGQGEPIELPSWSMRVTVPAGVTGGAFTVIRGTMAPRLAGPPTHVHDGHDETFVVISGLMRFQLGDRVEEIGPGGTAFAPRGSTHGFLNAGDTEAHYAAFVAPSGYEEYFRDVQAHLTANGVMPDIETTRRLMAEHATRLA